MMRQAVIALCGLLSLGASAALAEERSITELPKDVWDLAFSWTEPIKQAAKQSKRSDPVSGLWFGVLDGSVKSMERTAGFLFTGVQTAASQPSQPSSPSLAPSNTGKTKPHALFRYSF